MVLRLADLRITETSDTESDQQGEHYVRNQRRIDSNVKRLQKDTRR